MKKVYHIASQAICDRFFQDLFKSIYDKSGIEQNIIVPYSDSKYKEPKLSIKNAKFFYLPIKSIFDRFLYFKKVKKYSLKMMEIIDKPSSADKSIIHAHSLFTDGGPGYNLSIKYNIPLVVSVRTTDVHFYFKYYKHAIPFIKKVLHHAKSVIFVTNNIKNDLYKYLNKKLISEVEKKSTIITNGVNQFWINNIKDYKEKDISVIKLIQVSRLTRIKNAIFSIKVLKELKKMHLDSRLKIVGVGNQLHKLKKATAKYGLTSDVEFLGYIDDREQIMHHLDTSNIFILPSKSETFGIAYFEALTQSLPVLYALNQGIYGLFPEGEVGYGIDLRNPKKTALIVIDIVNRYNEYSSKTADIIKGYSWDNIAVNYINNYDRVIGVYNEE